MAPTRITKRVHKQSTLPATFFKKVGSDAKSSPTPTPSSVARSKAKSRAAVAAVASDRVETDVLLAIQPLHLANIVAQRKNHEYRKYRLRDGVERLWLYETRGDKENKGRAAITHIATIPSDIRRTPGTVPEEPFGIGNSDFNAGLKQSKYGYPILELYKLVRPITLDEMKTTWGMGGAPMGWCFMKKNMWQDRWGNDEEGRQAIVTKIF
ncbi:hypothetical protein PT974_06988 [Cladobotryum mycophilum]|uniref:ASCH domain-containing protein n=1 Tax=Cladobotryum mycophilum TaxID=491253 RepID=A0ABR0SN84_9HYPO